MPGNIGVYGAQLGRGDSTQGSNMGSDRKWRYGICTVSGQVDQGVALVSVAGLMTHDTLMQGLSDNRQWTAESGVHAQVIDLTAMVPLFDARDAFIAAHGGTGDTTPEDQLPMALVVPLDRINGAAQYCLQAGAIGFHRVAFSQADRAVRWARHLAGSSLRRASPVVRTRRSSAACRETVAVCLDRSAVCRTSVPVRGPRR